MRFLIIKMSALGDIVHAYPVLTLLKTAYPDCKIDWVVETRMAGLVSKHSLVDKVIQVDAKGLKKNWFSKASYKAVFESIQNLRKERYDAVFDLQGNSKSALISLLTHGKSKVSFGFKTAPEVLAACVATVRYNPTAGQNIRQDYLEIVESYLGSKHLLPEQPLLQNEEKAITLLPHTWIVCPGSAWPNKKLSHDQLTRFLKRIQERYSPAFLFLAGSDAEQKEAELLRAEFEASASILNRPSFELLQHTMNRVELVIAMDSLPLHLAATTKTKTFSIFGPSLATKYGPLGPMHGHVQGSCPYNETFTKRCKKLRSCPTGACMRDLDPDDLFTKFSSWYTQTR